MRGADERHQRDGELGLELRNRVTAPPLRAGFTDELWMRVDTEASEASRDRRDRARRRSRFGGRRLLVAAAVAAAAAVFAFAALPALHGADTATAADVARAMAAAGAHTVRLQLRDTFAWTTTPGDVESGWHYRRTRETLILATDGSWRSTTWLPSGEGRDESYDAASREARSRTLGVSVAASNRHMRVSDPAVRFEDNAYSSDAPSREFSEYAASARAALAAADPEVPVHETTYAGRNAWRIAFPFKVTGGFGPYRTVATVTIVVDQATGIPLLARFDSQSGSPWAEVRVTSVEEDPLLSPGWQRVHFPDGARVTVLDNGTRFGTLPEIAERSWPTLPLIPSWLPAGDRLSQASTNGVRPSVFNYPRSADPGPRTTSRGKVTLTRIVWPCPTARVELVYANGYRRFAIEVYPKREFGPMSDKPSSLRGVEVLKLKSGFLAGRTAVVSVAPFLGKGPTLQTESDRSSVVIWGDLTPEELLRIANALYAIGDVDKPLGRL